MEASATTVKNMKPTQEPLKAQKELVFTTEPMKTRRSHYTEDRKLITTAQSAPTPALTTPGVERRTEQAAAGTLCEKEHKDEVKEEKTVLPHLSLKKSHPPKATPELEEDLLASVVKPAEESEEVISEPRGPSESLKRKPVGEMEGELTPEKRPRMSSVSPASSVSSVSPTASSTSSPSTPTPKNQRVPPLKVGKRLCTQSLL